MASICLYFQVHQPYRIKNFSFFDLGKNQDYFDEKLNREVLNKVSEKCYLPANELFLDLIEKQDIKITFSLSGVFLEQIEQYRPDVLASFQKLIKTGNVEILAETYYHSLAFFYSKKEFKRQIKLHQKKVELLFNVTPTVFRNTELLFNNELASTIKDLGYQGILTEGTDENLKGRSPNQVYLSQDNLPVLTRNYKLTDDVAFRFSSTSWKQYPLTSEKYSNWLKSEYGETINLFMDYETIGEHHWKDTGIFNFWNQLPVAVQSKGLQFQTVSEIISKLEAKKKFDAPQTISWADSERDLSAWLGNDMQKEAAKRLYNLEKAITTRHPKLLNIWAKLLTSDHLYYVSTKHESDRAVHDYFSPFSTPYDAYLYLTNILSDLELSISN